MMRFTTEPAAWGAFVQAVVSLVVLFVDLPAGFAAAAIAVTAAAVGLLVRRNVEPLGAQ